MRGQHSSVAKMEGGGASPPDSGRRLRLHPSSFLTVLSWFLKLNSAAFFWSLANLFSYLDTFFRVGLMNFPLKSLTAMFFVDLKIPLSHFKLHIIFLGFTE